MKSERLRPESVKLDLPRLLSERGNVVYGFDAFKKGQSVLLTDKKKMIRTRNAAYTYQRRWNKKRKAQIEFRCVRSEAEGGWRLVRIR